MPAIFYPQASRREDSLILDASAVAKKYFQPTDHVANLLEINSPERFWEEMFINRQYDGYCVDTYHLQRRYGRPDAGLFSDLDSSLEPVAKNARAMHLSLNRSDTKNEPHIETMADLQSILKGKLTGKTRLIVDALKDKGSIEFATIEVTLGGLKEVSGYRKIKDLRRDYQLIGQVLRDYFS